MTAIWHDPHQPVDVRVEALLDALTLEEKAAQLGSYWLRPDQADSDVAPLQSSFDEGRASFEESITLGLGHITRAFGSAPLAPDQGVKHLRRLQEQVMTAGRFRIPAIAHEECLTGFTTMGATCYPSALAWGATFEPDLVREMARRIGMDMSSVGVHQGLSPVLDVVRDYRWGRVEETMGEDPYLVGSLGVEYVRGLQSAGVIATLKHFVGYSASRSGRNHAPVSIGRRELEDVLLVPFEMAIRLGGARSVMNSYADIDGVPPGASHHLLTELLRERWGFEGSVVSDYWSVSFLESMHHVAASPAEAGVLALRAGLDVELPETSCFRSLPDAVREGRLDEAVLDRAVRRVLSQKVQLGLLDTTWEPTPSDSPDDLDPASNRDHARRMAERSIVLVDNDGALPLAAGSSKIALIGPTADQPRTYLGCYSFPNHVLSRFEEAGAGVHLDSLVEALRRELPDARIDHVPGVGFTEPDRTGIPAAVRAARAADVAVVAVGDLAGLFGRGTSGEGCDVADLSLPGVQHDLVEAVLETGTPTVLVLVTGRPYAVGSYVGRAAAIVQAFMPGEEGGRALAGVLSGRVCPSGKLPVGLPAHGGGQPGTYLTPTLGSYSDGVSNLDPRPAYPFGHGLSYTSFRHSDLHLTEDRIDPDGEVRVSSTVTNTGSRAGAEVVQLYLSDVVSQVVRPIKQLTGFAKVDLQPGESRRVEFTIHADRTSFIGSDGRRIVEPGQFTVHVGSSSEDHDLTGSFAIRGEPREIEDAHVLTTPVRLLPHDELAG